MDRNPGSFSGPESQHALVLRKWGQHPAVGPGGLSNPLAQSDNKLLFILWAGLSKAHNIRDKRELGAQAQMRPENLPPSSQWPPPTVGTARALKGEGHPEEGGPMSQGPPAQDPERSVRGGLPSLLPASVGAAVKLEPKRDLRTMEHFIYIGMMYV